LRPARATTTTSRFDARGLLAARTVSAGTIHTVEDRDGRVIAELDGATGDTLRDYIWLGDMPLAAVDHSGVSPEIWFVHPDHLNRPEMMTDASRTIVWQALWYPWGEAYSATGSATLDMRFPGQWFQAESGLAYNWHRQYDATLGRYTQPDPLGVLEAGPSVYGYAEGNPVKWTDPTGLASGDIPCQGFSAGCQNGGSYGTTAMYCINGRNVCHDCAVKLLGIQGFPGGAQASHLRPFLLPGFK
jgi:RHS repeat-associated protein